jgi:hypothetical protein
MKPQIEIDIHTLLPAKRQMMRAVAIIALLSLICGILLGLLVYYAPQSGFAQALGNAFVVGGAAAFSAPGGGLLALGAGLVWGLCFAFVAAFIYIAWLIYHVSRGYKELQQEQRMTAYRRAISGKQPE